MSGKDQNKKVNPDILAGKGINANQKVVAHSQGNRRQKFKSGAMKAVATVLLATTINHAIAQKAPSRNATKRTTPSGSVKKPQNVVDSIKPALNTTVVKGAKQTIETFQTSKEYPLNLGIFDTTSTNLTPAKLDEFKTFLEDTSASSAKKLKVFFMRGNKESKKAYLANLVEARFGQALMATDGKDTIRFEQGDSVKLYDIYHDYYIPFMNKINKAGSINSEEGLITLFADKIVPAYVDPTLAQVNNKSLSKGDRTQKAREYFDLMGNFYARLKFMATIINPTAVEKGVIGEDPLTRGQEILKEGSAPYNKLIEQSGGFDLEHNTFDQNMKILEGALNTNNADALGGIIKMLRGTNGGREFMVKYRMKKFVITFVEKFEKEKDVDKKLDLLQKFGQTISYGGDLSDITMDGVTVREYLSKKLTDDFEKNDYTPVQEDRLENYRKDLNWDQIFGEQSITNNDMKFAQINEDLDEARSEETLYKYYKYFNHLSKMKYITDENKWIIGHISKQDKKTGKFLFTNAVADFSSLYYVSLNHLGDLVEEMNRNPHIKTVKFNLSLLRNNYKPENYIAAMKLIGGLQKDVEFFTQGESVESINAFVEFHNKRGGNGHSLTYTADQLSEAESHALHQYTGTLKLPNVRQNPYNSNEAFKSDIVGYKNRTGAGEYEVGFYELGMKNRKTLKSVFNTQSFNLSFPGVEKMQPEELDEVVNINSSLTFPSLNNLNLRDKARLIFDFGLPPQTSGEYTKADFSKKKQKASTYNNLFLPEYNGLSEEEMQFAGDHYMGTTLELGSNNLQDFSYDAYRKMINLQNLTLRSDELPENLADSLQKTKVRYFTMKGLKQISEGNENSIKKLVKMMKSLSFPNVDTLGTVETQAKLPVNKTMKALMSGDGDILLQNKKGFTYADALAIKDKSAGYVDLSGLQYISLQIDEDNTVSVTPDNFSHWRKQCMPLFEAIRKSGAKVNLGKFQIYYDNYVSVKKK